MSSKFLSGMINDVLEEVKKLRKDICINHLKSAMSYINEFDYLRIFLNIDEKRPSEALEALLIYLESEN